MNEDTLHLLSECAAGTDMAIRSLEDVLKNSAEGPLQKRLLDSKRQHEQLAAQAADRLRRQGKEPKRADPAARAMSYLKTRARLSMQPGGKKELRSVSGDVRRSVQYAVVLLSERRKRIVK